MQISALTLRCMCAERARKTVRKKFPGSTKISPQGATTGFLGSTRRNALFVPRRQRSPHLDDDDARVYFGCPTARRSTGGGDL